MAGGGIRSTAGTRCLCPGDLAEGQPDCAFASAFRFRNAFGFSFGFRTAAPRGTTIRSRSEGAGAGEGVGGHGGGSMPPSRGGEGGGDDDGWPRSPVWVEWYCGVVALWLVLRNIALSEKEVVEK